jgi:hypothetical protein
MFPIKSYVVADVSLTGMGTFNDDNLPKQVCGLISKRGDVPGKHGRGRIYMPFPMEVDSAPDGRPTPGYIAANAAWAALGLVVSTRSFAAGSVVWIPVIYRRSNPALSSYILSSHASEFWATQRKRGDYGRPNAIPIL